MTGNVRRSFYFDMDGVLVCFDDMCDKSVIFKPGGHYFRTCERDERAVSVAKCLSVLPDADVFVLTRLPRTIPEAMKDEQSADKRLWCEKNLDFRAAEDWSKIDVVKRFMCTDGKKSEAMNFVPAHERRLHVLIDDDVDVLAEWADAGGSCVQYVQPFHAVRLWYGIRILATDSVTTAIRKILSAPDL